VTTQSPSSPIETPDGDGVTPAREMLVRQPATTLERAVALVLRTGVLASAAMISVGVVVTLASSASSRAARRSIPVLRRGVIHPHSYYSPHTVASVIQGVGDGRGPAIVMLGLLLLIVTPVLRVAVSVIGYALERDRRFVLITVLVLIVLIGSFAVGE
jgi:uncharacterized membrane protein